MKRCDLHTHSKGSDGTLQPDELVRLAKEIGLSAVALTDHNTSCKLADFMQAGRDYGVITVPGCEFTTEYAGYELHIVGLFFAEDAWPEIEDYVYLPKLGKQISNTAMIEALQRDGYDVTEAEAAALTDAEIFNRNQVARVLVDKGYFPDKSAAFSILQPGGKYYTPSDTRLKSLPTIRFIRRFGGVAIFAHPYLSMDADAINAFLPLAKEAGLDGMETLYSTYDAQTTQTAIETAARFGLLQSGGSDFHGAGKDGIDLGVGRGDLCIPFSFYESLLSLHESRK